MIQGDFSWLQMPALAALLSVLGTDGEEARVVGGAVRNTLLGEAVDEWDIATTALPQIVTQRAEQAGWKTAATGIAHGTVTVVVNHHPFEVTTLREDVATDGRRAQVRFGRDFRADAFRRDFTINALSISADGKLYDYADGMADIARRRIRFIGDADQRIAEDYLRILRLFRLHARYGSGPVDDVSLAASIRGRDGLERLSAERIHAELLKTVMAGRVVDVVQEMNDAGLLHRLLGGVVRVNQLRHLTFLEARTGIEPDAVRRLGVLSLFTGNDAARLTARLRLSRAETARLAIMASALETIRHPPSPDMAHVQLYRLGRQGFEDAMLAAAAAQPDQDFSSVLSLPQNWPVPPNPYRGRDVARLGIAAGPEMGRVLSKAENMWINHGFPQDRHTQQAILEAAAKDTAVN